MKTWDSGTGREVGKQKEWMRRAVAGWGLGRCSGEGAKVRMVEGLPGGLSAMHSLCLLPDLQSIFIACSLMLTSCWLYIICLVCRIKELGSQSGSTHTGGMWGREMSHELNSVESGAWGQRCPWELKSPRNIGKSWISPG